MRLLGYEAIKLSSYQLIIIFTHSDHEAQPWGGPKADISEAFRPTGNGGVGTEPPHQKVAKKVPKTNPKGAKNFKNNMDFH